VKIEFTRSGGFANIPMTVRIDTAAMPAAAARDLEAKIAAAGFFGLPASLGANAQLRDAHTSTITVTSPEHAHTVTITGEAPAAVQALIDHLVRAARDARAAGRSSG